MNNIEYNRAGKGWDKNEEIELVKEYNIDKLNLLDICKIHKRRAGGIISRLKHLNLVDEDLNVRGYSEYQKKNQEELNKKNNEDIIKNDNITLNKETNNNNLECINKTKYRLQRKQIPNDIVQIKKDINEIKSNINKLLELMNAVYEFENNIE